MRASGCGRTPATRRCCSRSRPICSLAELDDVVHIARSRRVDGMIVANTTLARPATLREQNRAKEQGGLSGRPLFRLSTRMVAETYVRAEGAFPLIGVGGIDSGGAALTKIRAGASLIQLYSSLVYKGLGLVDDIKNDLASTLLRTGRDSLSEIVGADAATITAEDWPVQYGSSPLPERARQRSASAIGELLRESGSWMSPSSALSLRDTGRGRTHFSQTTSAASPDSAAPATRRARRSAPAARPTARHCRTIAAPARRRGRSASESTIRLRMSRAQVAPI